MENIIASAESGWTFA